MESLASSLIPLWIISYSFNTLNHLQERSRKRTTMAKKKTLNFESSLEELEGIVEDMEGGELSLEASLKAFEKGIKLTRECQEALNQAEQKVLILMEKSVSTGAETADDDKNWQTFDSDKQWPKESLIKSFPQKRDFTLLQF